MSDCPLCSIPQREKVLYQDNYIYLAQTKDMKGHTVRVMAASKRHAQEPTFEERTHAYAALMNYMKNVGSWYIVDSTYASVPEHFHIVACDALGDEKELSLLAKTPKVPLPLRRVLIGIPAHNEKGHIARVVKSSIPYGKVLVLDNGSDDDTAQLAYDAGAAVEKRTQSGYGFALQEIFNYAKFNDFDVLVTLDGDGQHNPDEIPRFLDALGSADLVIGNRFLGGGVTPLIRRVVIAGLNAAYRVGDSQCGFRAYNRKAIESVKIAEEDMGASLEILFKAQEAGLKVVEVPVKVAYDDPEPPFSRVLRQGMNLVETMFWGFIWARPYTYLGVPAVALLFASLGFGAYALNVYVAQRYLIPSFALLCGVSFLASLLLGSFAFYVAISRKIVKEVMRR